MHTDMHVTIHPLIGLYEAPQDWPEAAVAALTHIGPRPVAVLAMQIVPGPSGSLLSLWPTEAAARTAADSVPPVGAGPGLVYRSVWQEPGDLGRARFAQLLTFGPTDDPEVRRARRVASVDRILPIVRALEGWREGVHCEGRDGSHVTVALAESLEDLEAMTAAVLSSRLLPGEDPAMLTGADRVELMRVVRATSTAGVGA